MDPSPAKEEAELIPQSSQARKYSLKKPGYPLLCSTRLAIAIVGFLGFANLYAQRVNMSVALVCMLNQTALYPVKNVPQDNQTLISTIKPGGVDNCNEKDSSAQRSGKDGEFAWEKPIQGHILASFFYGYLITQVPGGILAHRFGGRHVFGWSMLACAIGTMLVPIGARVHYGLLIALRVLIGVMQGFSWPAMHGVWSHWAPPLERSILIGGTFAGSQVGSVLALSTSGILCDKGFDGGWPTIFYIYGTAGVIWVIAWLLIVADTPAKHPRMNPQEREYIETVLLSKKTNMALSEIPWRAFATSVPLWGIIGTQFCGLWGVYTFLTNIPTYMSEILKFNIQDNGLLSSLPYVGFWITIHLSATIADKLRQKKILSTTWTRKLFNSIGSFGPALFIIILANLGCRHTVGAVITLFLGVSCSGCLYGAGFIVNHADIAPPYSSLLFGITNTFGTIPGILGPTIIGKLTANKLRSEWQTVFYITAAIFCVGGVIYLLFGSGEVQPWAKTESQPAEAIELKEQENKESQVQPAEVA